MRNVVRSAVVLVAAALVTVPGAASASAAPQGGVVGNLPTHVLTSSSVTSSAPVIDRGTRSRALVVNRGTRSLAPLGKAPAKISVAHWKVAADGVTQVLAVTVALPDSCWSRPRVASVTKTADSVVVDARANYAAKADMSCLQRYTTQVVEVIVSGDSSHAVVDASTGLVVPTTIPARVSRR